MENILQAQKNIDAVYTHDDDMAQGVVQAIRNAGREDEMFLTGVGGSQDAMKQIKEGGLYRATFLYNPNMATARGASEAALACGAGYVGLVASAKRAGALTAELRERGVDEESLARMRSPAGLDLGPSSQEEIAVAILAELVAWRHTRGPSPAELVEEAIDPICGMTVAVAAAKETSVRDGVTYYFCSAHCRKQFEAAPV